MLSRKIERTAIIVPAYNEPGITKTLQGLYDQQLRRAGTHHFVVDNNSSDDTRERIETFANTHMEFPLTVLEEGQKGTGAAVDTGFQEAISLGFSVIARTDADTVPTPLWSSLVIDNFEANKNLQLLGGKSLPLKDEQYRFGDSLLLPLGIKGAMAMLAIKHMNVDFLKVAVGHNMATRSGAYLAVGGIERSSIDEIDEDIVYSLKIADMYGLKSIKIDTDVLVETSMRRIRKYGIGGTALHHLFPELRKNHSDGVDIR
jgi:glycosyltransferase involved in cell wall biosynthesis